MGTEMMFLEKQEPALGRAHTGEQTLEECIPFSCSCGRRQKKMWNRETRAGEIQQMSNGGVFQVRSRGTADMDAEAAVTAQVSPGWNSPTRAQVQKKRIRAGTV